MDQHTTKGIIILIEDDLQIGENIEFDLTAEGYETWWIKDLDSLFEHYRDMITWADEHLERVKAIIFDFYLDERNEDSTLPFVSDFLRLRGSRPWVLMANSSLDDRNADLMREGCTHSRPTGTKKQCISNYLLQVLGHRS